MAYILKAWAYGNEEKDKLQAYVIDKLKSEGGKFWEKTRERLRCFLKSADNLANLIYHLSKQSADLVSINSTKCL